MGSARFYLVLPHGLGFDAEGLVLLCVVLVYVQTNAIVDDVRLYDRALSVGEVKQLHNEVVPVPSAFLLGVLGLGVVGRKLHRRRIA